MTATAALVLALVLFTLGGMNLVERLGAMLTRTAGARFSTLDDPAVLLAWTLDLLTEGAWICVAVVLLMAAPAALLGSIQVGAVFSLDPVMPRLSRLNPIEGAKRLFSLRNLVELVKLIVISIALAAVLWWVARAAFLRWCARSGSRLAACCRWPARSSARWPGWSRWRS